MMEEYMIDYLKYVEIKCTRLYIFPTKFGGERSFSHWLGEGYEDMKGSPFLRYRLDASSMIGNAVDVIVNSANTKLIPGSGLAKYLRERLSFEYSDGCQNLQLMNPEFGEAYFIPIYSQYRILKGVIEAISIKYDMKNNQLNHTPTMAKDVYKCVFTSLELAEKQCAKSIAIPQIASRKGYSFYKEEDTGKSMLSATILAIKDYLYSHYSSIEEIFLHPTTKEDEEFLLKFLSIE